MKRSSLLLFAAALVLARPSFADSPSPDAAFEKIARDYVEDYLRLNPEEATELGDHRFDGRLSDYSPEGIAESAAILRRNIAALDGIDAKTLTDPDRIDYRILRDNL